jgi:hypothetical protein
LGFHLLDRGGQDFGRLFLADLEKQERQPRGRLGAALGQIAEGLLGLSRLAGRVEYTRFPEPSIEAVGITGGHTLGKLLSLLSLAVRQKLDGCQPIQCRAGLGPPAPQVVEPV